MIVKNKSILFFIAVFISFAVSAQKDSIPTRVLDTVTVNTILTMYPGPGILPADGRTFYITAKIKI